MTDVQQRHLHLPRPKAQVEDDEGPCRNTKYDHQATETQRRGDHLGIEDAYKHSEAFLQAKAYTQWRMEVVVSFYSNQSHRGWGCLSTTSQHTIILLALLCGFPRYLFTSLFLTE